MDIAEPQVLVHYPDDPGGYHWRHRNLLARGGAAGQWVCLTPGGELLVHDFSALPHTVLGRAEAWDENLGEEIYCFDLFSKAELAEYIRLARLQARMLYAGREGDPAVEVRAEAWVVAGPGAGRLGEVVPAEVLNDAARFRELGGRAVADLGDGIYFAEKVADGDREGWVRRARAAERDDRFLGLHLRGG